MPAADYDFALDVKGIASLQDLVDPKKLATDLALMHRKLAFMSIEHAIRGCSVDTGRARAGFLALHRKHGLTAADSMRRPPPGRSFGRLDPAAISDGLSKGRVITDRAFEIVIANAVGYVEFINSGTSRMAGTNFLDRTMQKTAAHADRVMAAYVESSIYGLSKATDKPDGVPEIPS